MLKKLHSKFMFLSAYISLMVLTPMMTYASGGAVEDILANPRFKGAITSIEKVTNAVDIWFVRIISFTAFFIIGCALLKNALAGLYVSNTKLWDKVDEAHKTTEAFKLADVKGLPGKMMNTSIGGYKNTILGFLPNIKALTDFEDTEASPKQYFMKAIPQMCAMVIIGIFIYNGYYRDVAATAGNTMAVMCENALGAVDPEKALEFAIGATKNAKYTFKDDTSIQGQYTYALAKEVYGKMLSNAKLYGESQETKQRMLTNVEYYMYRFVVYNETEGVQWANGSSTSSSSDMTNQNLLGDTTTPVDEGASTLGTDGSSNVVTSESIFAGTGQYYYDLSGVSASLTYQMGQSYVQTDAGTTGSATKKSVHMIIPITAIISDNADEGLMSQYVVLNFVLTPRPAKTNDTYATAVTDISKQSMSGFGDAGFTTVDVSVDGSSLETTSNGGVTKYKVTWAVIGAEAISQVQSKIAEQGGTYAGMSNYGFTGGSGANGYSYIQSSGEVLSGFSFTWTDQEGANHLSTFSIKVNLN